MSGDTSVVLELTSRNASGPWIVAIYGRDLGTFPDCRKLGDIVRVHNCSTTKPRSREVVVKLHSGGRVCVFDGFDDSTEPRISNGTKTIASSVVLSELRNFVRTLIISPELPLVNPSYFTKINASGQKYCDFVCRVEVVQHDKRHVMVRDGPTDSSTAWLMVNRNSIWYQLERVGGLTVGTWLKIRNVAPCRDIVRDFEFKENSSALVVYPLSDDIEMVPLVVKELQASVDAAAVQSVNGLVVVEKSLARRIVGILDDYDGDGVFSTVKQLLETQAMLECSGDFTGRHRLLVKVTAIHPGLDEMIPEANSHPLKLRIEDSTGCLECWMTETLQWFKPLNGDKCNREFIRNCDRALRCGWIECVVYESAPGREMVLTNTRLLSEYHMSIPRFLEPQTNLKIVCQMPTSFELFNTYGIVMASQSGHLIVGAIRNDSPFNGYLFRNDEILLVMDKQCENEQEFEEILAASGSSVHFVVNRPHVNSETPQVHSCIYSQQFYQRLK